MSFDQECWNKLVFMIFVVLPISPALLVLSEQTIPEAYWLPQPPKLDRQGLLGELKRGVAIPGAELSNPKPVLMVRTK
jgi:hypothetical protein